MLKETNQTSRKYRIAAYNARLHQNSICPANHNVEYANGWYYYDGEPEQRPDITAKARKYEERFDVDVYYNNTWNTYVFARTNPETGWPEQGQVSV